MTENTIDAILSPVGRAAFLAEYWNTSFLRVQGRRGRFQHLLSWEDLNHILEHHRLEPPRFSLVQKGKTLDPARYLLPAPGKQRINAGALAVCLSQGATLVLDEVEEMATPLRDLAESCAEVLQSKVTVNLYGSWRTQNGFDLHWDPQDTLILQVAGRKHWKVFRPTRPHPLDADIREPAAPADADVVWEGILDDGDMIYMPRGWWHVATPLDEPSLHLTVTIVPPRGIEFLKWLVEDMREDPAVRMDVPRLAGPEARQAFEASLRAAMAHVWSTDALSRFLEVWDSRRPARPRLRLPDVSSPDRPITAETRIRLSSARRIAVTRIDAGETVQLHANGHVWTCAAPLVPALQQLSDTRSLTIRELCERVPDAASGRALRSLLTVLAMAGVVVTE